MGEARFEELAGTVDVALARVHVAQQAQREAGVAVRPRRLATGEYLLSPRASRIVVAVIESELRHPEPGQRLHPCVAGRFRTRQALQEERLCGRTLAPPQRGPPK